MAKRTELAGRGRPGGFSRGNLMKTISVIARKGGAGKSTIAAHVALAAHLRGQKVLLADADAQGSAAEVMRMRRGDGPQWAEARGGELYDFQVTAQRAGIDTLVIDTPAGADQDIGQAVVLADLCMLVVRPTYLDIAAALQTTDILRRLNRPALIVLNQAPAGRAGEECAQVEKARAALRFTRLPVAESVIRTRLPYQTALAMGRSVEELDARSPAAAEMAALWSNIEALACAPRERLRA